MSTGKVIMVRRARFVPVCLFVAAVVLGIVVSPWWLLSIPFVAIGALFTAPNLNLVNGMPSYLTKIPGIGQVWALAPFQGANLLTTGSRGYRPLMRAQPPANGWQPSGLRGTAGVASVQTANLNAGDECRRSEAKSASLCFPLKTIATIAAVAAVLALVGCSGKRGASLVGTWQTDVIPSEWGSNRITVTYFADGRIAGTNDFSGHGTLTWQGTYRVRGSVIDRTVEGRTQAFVYRLDGDTMSQKFGNEEYTFKRIITRRSTE